MEPVEYLAEIKARLVASAVVAEVTTVEEYILPDRGYFRARLRLSNHDFLEVAEYFVVASGLCMTQRYRYQWMDETQSILRRRWDNVGHFPALPNFPHHVHVGNEEHVESGQAMSIMELIAFVEREQNRSGLA